MNQTQAIAIWNTLYIGRTVGVNDEGPVYDPTDAAMLMSFLMQGKGVNLPCTVRPPTVNLTTGKTNSYAEKERKTVSDFLRMWADALEGVDPRD